MSAPRVSREELERHLIDQTPKVRAIVRALRAAILKAVPRASEAFKFHVLCYYRADAYFGSIGGNICMIEVKQGQVLLSFILGAKIADPGGLLFGTGKSKRFLRVADAALARSGAVAKLVRAAARVDLSDVGPARTKGEAPPSRRGRRAARAGQLF